MTARLTIAIPTFNRAHLLERALQSALAQTSDLIEILVSDNGSTDDTPAVIARFSDRRLRSIRREETVTRAQHGTLIFAETHTELILVLSDDDYIEPEFSDEIIRLFDEQPELSFAYTGCMEHYDNQTLPALVGPRIESSLDFIAAHYAGKRQVSWCACVTRVRDLRRLGPQPADRIIGDMFFWTKIAFQGPVGCVARPLSHYTVLIPGGDNESRTTPILAWAADAKRLSEEVMLSARNEGASDNFQEALRANMSTQITRSIANQFIWARLFGMSRSACLRVLPASLAYEGWNVHALLRVCAAILLTRRKIRDLVVRGVARLAAGRAKD
jgi:glycosyltransferase involved in cell wall biosynthesis